MIKKNITIGLMSMIFLPITAQNVKIKNDVIDCGQVIYQQPVTAKFELKNENSTPINIEKVYTSCGCTMADYPKNTIEKDANFYVSATYDAKLMGAFEKQITMKTNAEQQPITLTIKGVVVNEMQEYIDNYDFSLGKLLSNSDDIEFDDVNVGDKPTAYIHIKNSATTAANPVIMHLPSYLKANVSPTTLLPGRTGVVKFTLDSKKIRDFGLTQTSVFLGFKPGDKVDDDTEITISTVLLPSFQNMTDEQLNNAPQVNLSSNSLDLGKFDGKSKKQGTIIIENNGKSNLEINSLQMFTEGLKVSLNKQIIKPGDSAKLKITAEKKGLKKTKRTPRVLMITNDPNKSKIIIPIKIK